MLSHVTNYDAIRAARNRYFVNRLSFATAPHGKGDTPITTGCNARATR